jgi:DNA polymerase-3 subunit delta'
MTSDRDGAANAFDLPPVIRDVPGQDNATAFLARALLHPHHAYVFTGPEGSGKRLVMRAFAAALLCERGGCGECRACRLAVGERHPNMLVLEPAGPDILVGKDASDPNTARWFAARAYLTPPEPGRKVMVVIQADRMRVEAADVLLKVLEEPPTDTVFVLVSARPDEIPETVRSRCQEISFPPLSEAFVVNALVKEGLSEERARLASRLAGGNLGRARRLARSDQELRSRPRRISPLRRRSSVARWARSWRGTSNRSWTSEAGPRRSSERSFAGWRSNTSDDSAELSGSSWIPPCWLSPPTSVIWSLRHREGGQSC